MAQTDYFLRLDGSDYDGESNDSTHKNAIDVLAWSWGESNTAAQTSGGLGAGKVMMQPISITMNVCKASPQIALACAAGKHIKKGTLICRRAGDNPLEYLKVEFENLLITSYSISGNAGDVVPVEHFTLDFQKIKWLYASQDAKGGSAANVQAGWDVTAVKAI